MPKLPVLRPRELVRALQKLGFLEKRQKGSHLIMVHEGRNKQIVIPIARKIYKTFHRAVVMFWTTDFCAFLLIF